MKQIAIFGGAFDPPHLGHVLVINAILNSGKFDKIIIVPTGNDRYDKLPHSKAGHRKKMIKLLTNKVFKNDKRIVLEPVQIDGKQPGNKAIDLVCYLKKKFPNGKFYYVIGVDNITKISSCISFKELVKQCKFLAVPR